MKRLGAVLLVALALAGCDPQKQSWGLDAIRTMKTPPDPDLPACGVVVPVGAAVERQSCSFGPGDLPGRTLGVDPAVVAQIPIRHVIIMMKENRSFDHLLGRLHDLQPAVEALPADWVNLDLAGNPVAPYHTDTTCIPFDPGHQWASMHANVNGGKMDGFVKNAARTTKSDGHFVMAYNDATDLPLDYFIASTWALNDAHFTPIVSGTFANRNFMLFGTNAGVLDTGIEFPSPNTPTLLHLLMNAGYTWGAYTDDLPFSASLNMKKGDPGVHTLQDLYDALDNGTLPNVAFVDGTDSVTDDHPTADLQKGEQYVKAIYDHVVKSPQWMRLAVIWTYDEGGSFADHVNPGQACAPTPGSPFTDRGPRVPLAVISPWAKRHYVSHLPQDHTAITRFVATLFNLPALSARDANSTALFDLFDFSCGRDLSFPVAPDPGTGGCAR